MYSTAVVSSLYHTNTVEEPAAHDNSPPFPRVYSLQAASTCLHTLSLSGGGLARKNESDTPLRTHFRDPDRGRSELIGCLPWLFDHWPRTPFETDPQTGGGGYAKTHESIPTTKNYGVSQLRPETARRCFVLHFDLFRSVLSLGLVSCIPVSGT